MYGLVKAPHRGLNLFGDLGQLLGNLPPLADESDFNFAPPLDIVETDDGYEITAELPGITKKELAVNIKENVLTIEAQTDEQHARKKDARVLSGERRIGRHYRAVRLGAAIDETKVRAQYADGVLKLTLPFAAKVQGKKIEVEAH